MAVKIKNIETTDILEVKVVSLHTLVPGEEKSIDYDPATDTLEIRTVAP